MRNEPTHMMTAKMSDKSGVSRAAIHWYFIFKIFGLLVPLIPIFFGYKLFILGVTGKASLVVNSTEFSGQLINAAPGLFFAVGGIAALIIATLKGIKYQQS